MLNRLFRLFMKQLLADPGFVQEFQLVIEKDNLQKKLRQVNIGANSVLYPESTINNIQNMPDNLIIGNNTHIRGELTLFAHGGKIEIGDFVYIGSGTRVWSADKIKIGNNVLISHNVNIVDTDSHEIDYIKRAETFQGMIERGHSKQNQDIVSCPIEIDDYAWLSFNVSVLKGVKIGKGAIVGAGSLVLENVEPFTVVGGVPAKVIKRLT